MTGYKKKIFAFLATAALCNVGGVVPASGETVLPKQGPAESTTAAPKKPLPDNLGSVFANDPNFSEKSGSRLDTQELFFKMMFSILLVVALGAATIYISKKFLPRITKLPGKAIHIVETVHLGPRKTVHLLKIGNQQLLIGSTSESITMLADVTGDSTNATADSSAYETDDN